MADERLDATISIRVTNQMKELIETQATQMGIKPSAYAFRLLKSALEGNATPNGVQSVQKVYLPQDSALITSLQSRIAGLEEQLEAVQRIVDDAQTIHTDATEALSSIDATVESAVQRTIDSCTQIVDIRVQEAIQKEMGAVLGESIA